MAKTVLLLKTRSLLGDHDMFCTQLAY